MRKKTKTAQKVFSNQNLFRRIFYTLYDLQGIKHCMVKEFHFKRLRENQMSLKRNLCHTWNHTLCTWRSASMSAERHFMFCINCIDGLVAIKSNCCETVTLEWVKSQKVAYQPHLIKLPSKLGKQIQKKLQNFCILPNETKSQNRILF